MTFHLLTKSNPKLEKGRGAGYWTFVLHLAPASLSGHNTCPMATQGCKAACLNTAGRGGIMPGHGILTHEAVEAGMHNTIQAARIRKTKLFFSNRAVFMHMLMADIEAAIRMALKAGLKPAFRLNGTSDIRWETIRVPAMAGTSHSSPDGYANVFEAFPEIPFYDYTKIANRRNIPGNYKLTFSLAEDNDKAADAALNGGMNVAVVFRSKARAEQAIRDGFELDGLRVPVCPGDETDLRFLDPAGHVVALYAKGNAKKDTSGFVRD